jgi:hypothetical protein
MVPFVTRKKHQALKSRLTELEINVRDLEIVVVARGRELDEMYQRSVTLTAALAGASATLQRHQEQLQKLAALRLEKMGDDSRMTALEKYAARLGLENNNHDKAISGMISSMHSLADTVGVHLYPPASKKPVKPRAKRKK